jgi:hypothetical protein
MLIDYDNIYKKISAENNVALSSNISFTNSTGSVSPTQPGAPLHVDQEDVRKF